MNGSRRLFEIGLLAVVAVGSAAAQTTTRVSISTSGVQANSAGPFTWPSISADGRYVAFESPASNLAPGDSNGAYDIFVHDRQTGTTSRVSISSAGAQGNGDSRAPTLSFDGRYVAFTSAASNLVAADTNAAADIFVHDRQAGVTTRESLSSTGTQANGHSVYNRISFDGHYVAFDSLASNLVLGDSNGASDVFVRDRQTGTTTRVSIHSLGAQGNAASLLPSISADGRFVAFQSTATNLVAADTNAFQDIFVRDRQNATTTRVSVSSSGVEGNGNCYVSSISADGRYVAFDSLASNLVAGDTNGARDVFVRDRSSNATTRASVSSTGAEANSGCGNSAISAEGRFVAFDSEATNLVAGDTNGVWDVFVRDRTLGAPATNRVSVDGASAQGNGMSLYPAISADGNVIAFESLASNLVAGDSNGIKDVFVRDRRQPTLLAFTCPGACPCGNEPSSPNTGCENSAGTGGAQLLASGTPSISADSLVLTSSGELPAALSIFLQGSDQVGTVVFGDGKRCIGGTLLRLYVKNAVGGVVSAPQGADPSVSARSLALGDPLLLGWKRYYQVYYRDANLAFCPDPGGSFNVTNALSAVWGL